MKTTNGYGGGALYRRMMYAASLVCVGYGGICCAEGPALYFNRAAGPGSFALLRAKLDGSDARKIASGLDLSPSSDGRKVVLTKSGPGAERHIALWDVATAKTHVIESVPGEQNMDGRLSPDGKWIALNHLSPEGWGVAVVGIDGKGFHPVLMPKSKEQTGYWAPVWAPDGKSLWVNDMKTLYQVDTTGKVLQQIAIGELLTPFGAGLSSGVPFQPNAAGTELVFAASTKDVVKGVDEPEAVFVLDVGTKKLARVSAKGRSDFQPVFDPTGTHIYFVSSSGDGKGGGGSAIYRMTTDGKEVKRLVENAMKPAF